MCNVTLFTALEVVFGSLGGDWAWQCDHDAK